eukprot:TRINITY_DN1298_c0_g1_i1.p1 TRINITY_DN1298_c0_g1~~TRINITY_DN1298_c0_g1_i1.p1  ORF type:complete len:552 (+),score=125.56 TRINITY_DN1298_c0_g1_i1:124-1779(+)
MKRKQPDDDDLAYPWDEEEEAAELAAAAGDDAEATAQAEAGWGEGYEDADDAEEGLAWDGDEVEAAAANVERDAEFADLNQDYEPEDAGRHERALLAKLRRDLQPLLRPRKFELEPFGSYVTNLGLPSTDDTTRSDLDMVLMFHGEGVDVQGDRNTRENLVLPVIQELGAWLPQRPGCTVKNIVRSARVPIVTFETKELEADISVQQPWGVLNSWHLRDLCEAGRPGRLRLLVRMVKQWAKSKNIHTAKDGALSSYGWSLLAAAYLMEIGALQPLLPKGAKGAQTYLDANRALQAALTACKLNRASGAKPADAHPKTDLWEEPSPLPAGSSEKADASPADLFAGFLEWLSDTVLGFAKKSLMGCGLVPLSRRHIVSVRPRNQAELRTDVTWSAKRAEHWSPSAAEVFMCIEEPLNGENVGRAVRFEGFKAIFEEAERGVAALAEFQADEPGAEGGDDNWQKLVPGYCALLELEPLHTRAQPMNGVGLGRGGGFKRPFQGGGDDEPAWKRPWYGHGGQKQSLKGVFKASGKGRGLPPGKDKGKGKWGPARTW